MTGPAVIAELKRGSPSRGSIRASLDVEATAGALAENGAAALSILTEENFFHGSLRDLQEASSATTLPCLRKDFIVDEFQILESRAFGADAILLIVAAFSNGQDGELAKLARSAQSLGMDVLCEVHDELELQRAISAGFGSGVIGVNNRNLRTFEVDLQSAEGLAPMLPPGALRVAESGIQSGADIRRLRQAGYQAFLVGESLMAANDPGEQLRQLLSNS